MSKISLVLALLLGLPVLAAGQAGPPGTAPPPVPALPDARRLTSYNLTASTCACSVGFAIYGDGTDVDQWIDVFVGGISYPSTDPTHGWSLSSATGSLGNIPRPITNAVLTFAQPQTGTVAIVGARRPRRASQFPESRGVTARELNQVITDITAENREVWDKLNGAIVGQPGEVLTPLPNAATRANQYLLFDFAGNPSLNVVALPTSVLTSANTWTGLQTFVAGIVVPGTANTGAKFGSAASATWPLSNYFFDTTGQTIVVVDPSGQGAMSLASRSSDWVPNAFVNPSITESVLSVHDKTTAGPLGKWGSYWQCETTPTAYTINMLHFCQEASFKNRGASVTVDPFTVNPNGGSIITRLDAGIGATSFTAKIDNGSGGAGTTLTAVGFVGGPPIFVGMQVTGAGVSANTSITAFGTGTGAAGTYTVNNSQLVSANEPMVGLTNPVSAAIQILNNGAKFNAGISIDATTLVPQSGILHAIQLATNQSLVWFGAAGLIEGYMAVDNSGVFQMVGAGGIITNGPINVSSITAIPAGGTVNGYTFSSTPKFGLLFGSGAPTVSAAQGSIYLRSDGAPYYNTNGSTGWSPMVPTGVTTVCTVTAGNTYTFTNGVLTTKGANCT